MLVQGPPGTGKTHTIANLLGHFLSQGKRVLVTSHTTKALSVVKDLLPKEIQPLCVTMLGDRKDLEQTSSELITRLTRLNVEDLEARIRALGLERHRLGTALADRRRRIFEQRRIEHEAVEFNGRRYTLTEIAKFLREAERLQALIPGEVAEGPLPLSFRELLELYGTNGRWDAETARDLSGLLPGFELLPDVDTMRGMNRRWRDVLAEDAGDVTIDERRSASGERLHAFMKGGETLLVAPESGISALTPAMDLSPLTETDEMKRLALSLGLADEGCREAFEQLERELAAANELALAVDRASLLDNRTVIIPDAIDADAAMKAAEWFTANDPDGQHGLPRPPLQQGGPRGRRCAFRCRSGRLAPCLEGGLRSRRAARAPQGRREDRRPHLGQPCRTRGRTRLRHLRRQRRAHALHALRHIALRHLHLVAQGLRSLY